jgi:serine/threonine protein kinase
LLLDVWDKLLFLANEKKDYEDYKIRNRKKRCKNYKSCINLVYLMIEEYKLVRQLGKGSYGEVLLVEDSQQHKFALKKVSKEKGTLFHEY